MKWEDCQGFENSPSEDYILLQARAFEREIIKYHGHSLFVSLSLSPFMYVHEYTYLGQYIVLQQS